MSLFKMSAGNPAGVDFEALKAAAGFQRNKVTRLRDLRPPEEQEDLFLPPPLESQQQALLESEVLLTPPPELTMGAQAGKSPARETGPDKAVLAEQLRQKKSAYRLEKLKDFQHLLQRLSALPSKETPRHWDAVKSQVLGLQAQISLPYTGKTALSEQDGMALLRPFLQRQAQKIECLRLNKAEMLSAVLDAEARILDKLRAPNPLPALEKVALLSLAEDLTRVLQLVWEKTGRTENTAKPTVTVSSEHETAALPQLTEISELTPEQLESRIFALRSQLQRCSEGEKATFQSQLQNLIVRQSELASAQRLDAAMRLQRSLDQQLQRLTEIQDDLAVVPQEGICRQLHRDALLLKNRSLNELRQNATLGADWSPLQSALLLTEKRLGYFQAVQAAPALNHHEQAEFQLPESWPGSAQEREALAQLLHSLQRLSQSFLALRTALELAQRRTRALARQAALTKIENSWEKSEEQSWEQALSLMSQLLKLGRPLTAPAATPGSVKR